MTLDVGSGEEMKSDDVVEVGEVDLPPGRQLGRSTHARQAAVQIRAGVNRQRCGQVSVRRRLRCRLADHQTLYRQRTIALLEDLSVF